MTDEELTTFRVTFPPGGTAVRRHRLGRGVVDGDVGPDGQVPVFFDASTGLVDCWPVDLSLI